MNILTYFTDKGIPKTGLSPLVKIVEVETSAIIASWVSMDEISDGWYKYNFDTYDYTKEYVVICDGGALLGQASRYIASAVDNSNLNMSKIVLNAQSSNHQEPGSIGEMISSTDDKIKRALGLLHENIYIDLPIYDENNKLTEIIAVGIDVTQEKLNQKKN